MLVWKLSLPSPAAVHPHRICWLALSVASVTPSRPCHVSSPRLVERSMRISRTALSCLLRLKDYGAYPAGAAFGAGRTTRQPLNSFRVWYSHPLLHRAQPKPCRFRANPQNFQDVSAFALTYILRLRSCKSMDAFVISSLPSLWSEP